MNTQDIKQTKNEPALPVEESKTVAPPVLDLPKDGWFFPNVGEGNPFGIEAATKEEAEAANRRHLESEHKKEKH